MAQDLLEFIYKDSSEIKNIIYVKSELNDAEKLLAEQIAHLRLDLHNILDLLPQNIEIYSSEIRQKYKICAISFVGKHSNIRVKAREDLMERIKNGQIEFGILVFKRGRSRSNRLTFHEIGSKAWVNSKLKQLDRTVFIDDSYDHYRSVRTMNIKGLRSFIYGKKNSNELLNILHTKTLAYLDGKN